MQELTTVQKGSWCEDGFEGLRWSQAGSLHGDNVPDLMEQWDVGRLRTGSSSLDL